MTDLKSLAIRLAGMPIPNYEDSLDAAYKWYEKRRKRTMISTPISDLTDRQKAVLFDYAVAGKLIKQSDVNQFLARIEQDKLELADRLSRLVGASDIDKPNVEPLQVHDQPVAHRQRRRPSALSKLDVEKARKLRTKSSAKKVPQVDPRIAASRKLQGRYLSLVRQFPIGDRGQFSAIAKEQGRAKAIKAMRAALGELAGN